MAELELLAGCVILEKDKILLVKEKKDWYWKIPSGKIDSGESPEQTAIRETKEETGLDVILTRKSGEYPFDFKDRSFLMHAYFAEIVGGKLAPRDTQGETINQVEWMPISELNTSNASLPNQIIYSFLGRT